MGTLVLIAGHVVVHACTRWMSDVIGSQITVVTDDSILHSGIQM